MPRPYLRLAVSNTPKDDPADADGYVGWQLNEKSRGELWHTVGTRIAPKVPEPNYNAFAIDILDRLQPFPGSLFGITHENNGDTVIVIRALPTIKRSVFKRRVVKMFILCLARHRMVQKPIVSEIKLSSVK
jgi:hypothetical protein